MDLFRKLKKERKNKRPEYFYAKYSQKFVILNSIQFLKNYSEFYRSIQKIEKKINIFY